MREISTAGVYINTSRKEISLVTHRLAKRTILKVVSEEKRCDWIPLKPAQLILNLLFLFCQELLHLCDIVDVHRCIYPQIGDIGCSLEEDTQIKTYAPACVVAVGAPAQAEVWGNWVEFHVSGDGEIIGEKSKGLVVGRKIFRG